MMKLCRNILLALLLFALIMPYTRAEQLYKVIKVVDGDTVYIDFNCNGKPDKGESVRLNGIDAFEIHRTDHLYKQCYFYNLTEKQALDLGHKGKKFAEQELLGKFVKPVYTGDKNKEVYGRNLMSIYYDNGKNYEVEMLKAGLATVYQKSNIAPQLREYDKFCIRKN